MGFKIGEKVRFLNEKGEGTVKKINGDGTVLVEVDGFDIPYLASDLVKVGFDTSKITKSEPPEPEAVHETLTVTEQPSIKTEELPEGVYLAFIPEKESELLSSPIEVLLYNKTAYHIYYSLFQKEVNTFFCSAFGETKPKANTSLLKVLRSELESLSNLRFQGIKFKKGELKPQEPIDITIKLKPVKFYKENNYRTIAELGCKAILFDLSGKKIWEEEKTQALPNTQGLLGREKAKKLTRIKHLEDLLGKENTSLKTEDEVDLHIEEILDDHRGMSNGEIVQVQLKHFQRKLDEAIAKHYTKITFIHGVGKGRLKEEIIQLLKEYKDIEYRDAPYSKYGYGATEVTIK